MIWVAITGKNIETATAVIRHPNCTAAALDLLAEAFPPIPPDAVSLRAPIVGENIALANVVETMSAATDPYDMFGEPPKETVLAVAFAVGFRKNRTLRESRTFCDFLLAGLDRHPPDISAASAAVDRYFDRPDLRNLGGWYLLTMSIPSYSNAVTKTTLLRVRSDLLALEIANRQGRALELMDFYGSGPYQRDEQTGHMFSVGPDGQAGTADDILLP
jgi:hypothetical protein